MKYKKKPVLTEATQWFQNGDHPLDHAEPVDGSTQLTEGQVVGFFRALHIPGSRYCSECGNVFQKHGTLREANSLNGEEKVCPGDYIVTTNKGKFYKVKAEEFETMYEPYVDG